MTNWVNFAEIRQKVSLEQVITNFYGITSLKKDGTKLIGPCPVHNGDNPRAFHADLQKNVWHCFTKCGKGGNQLDFVVEKDGVSVREAALRLKAHFLSGRTEDEPKRQEQKPPTQSTEPVRAAGQPAPQNTVEKTPSPEASERNPPLELDLPVKGDHPHLVQDRHLPKETVEHFGVGYCSRGILRGAIAIPVHDEDGNLVAYAGRHLKPQTIREHGKYKFPKGFRKELVLYNLHRTKEAMKKHGLILVEGFFTVMTLHACGIENAVACMGCELSDHQADLLAGAKEVIVLFDGDDAGRNGTNVAKAKLEERNVVVRVVHVPDGAKPDGLSPRLLRWLVNGLQGLGLTELRFETQQKEGVDHG